MQKQQNNLNLLCKIRSAEILKHLPFLILGILSWLGFSYLFLLFIKLNQSRTIYDFPWHDDAPIWQFKQGLMGAIIMILIKWEFGLLSEKSKNLFSDFIILILLIPFNAVLTTSYYQFIDGSGYSGRNAAVEYNLVVGSLSGVIMQTFVAMTCIGYFYLSLVTKTNEKLAAAQQAKTEMELKTLRQNIEPHFLFNNLNVLSSLIESNPTRANEFLSKMSQIYRYILRSQAAEFVPLKDEIEFAKDYIFLLKERFGAAYDFDWQVREENLNGQMIVPVSLQSLIENAVKHNAGNPENPLQIAIKLENEYLTVENEMREKFLTFQTNKSGLENLRNRYAHLTEKQLEIVQNDLFFKVRLPLLHAE